VRQYYASVSTDPSYTEPVLKSTAPERSHHFSECAVFHMLDAIRPTSCGLDILLDWFLRMAAPPFALPLSYLFILSVHDSIVPSQRKTGSITPVRKVVKPQSCQEYRPISVTPISSRLMEKAIVRSFIYSVFVHPYNTRMFNNQFAFSPHLSPAQPHRSSPN